MEWVGIVTVLALMQVFVFAFQTGQMRAKHGVSAPAMSGAPEFERMFRVHMNSVEQIVLLVPALWMFGIFVNMQIAAGLGLVYVIGRQVYKAAYLKDPSSRSTGFSIGAIAMTILMLGSLGGAVWRLIQA